MREIDDLTFDEITAERRALHDGGGIFLMDGSMRPKSGNPKNKLHAERYNALAQRHKEMIS